MSNKEKYTAVVQYLMGAFADGEISHAQFCIGMTRAAKAWGNV